MQPTTPVTTSGTAAEPARTKRAPRLSALDVLRFLAALSVVGYHYTVKAPAAPEWDGPVPQQLVGFGTWAAYGAMGVSLFFVISGFVILMTAWGRDVPHFVASRIGRLFPGYWVSAAVAAVLTVVAWPAGLERSLTKGQILLNFTMFHAAYKSPDLDRVYWTLFYEARFYVLIAIFMLIGITRQRVLAFAALWPLVGAMAQSTGQDYLTVLLMPDYAPFFAGGMLIYVLYRDGHDLLTWLLLGMNAVIALNFSMEHFTGALFVDTGFPIHKSVVGLVAVSCFGLVALVSLTPIRRMHARWMVVAGSLSYPLYLVHQTTGWYLIHLLHPLTSPWVAMGVATTVALLMAVLLHYCVEKPLGHRLRSAVLKALRKTSVLDKAARTSAEPAVPPAPAAPAAPATPAAPAAPAADVPTAAVPAAEPLAVPAVDVPRPAAGDGHLVARHPRAGMSAHTAPLRPVELGVRGGAHHAPAVVPAAAD